MFLASRHQGAKVRVGPIHRWRFTADSDLRHVLESGKARGSRQRDLRLFERLQRVAEFSSNNLATHSQNKWTAIGRGVAKYAARIEPLLLVEKPLRDRFRLRDTKPCGKD